MLASIPVAQPVSSATAPVVETTAAPTPDATPAQLESTRFSHLAKKEAELQKQRESFKAEQTQFMTERQKFNEIQKQLNTFNETKAKDPVAALKLLGFNEKDLFNFIAAQEDNSTPEERAAKAAQNEIQKFRDEQAKIANDAQSQRNTEALTQFRTNIKSTISMDPDKYEYCAYNGPMAEELVYETMAAIVKDEGVVIPVEEVVEMVEQYYEEQDKEMNSLKKRQPKPQEMPAKEEPLKPQVSPRPNQARALSSKVGATVASTVSKPLNETSDQKKARLINKYLGSKQ